MFRWWSVTIRVAFLLCGLSVIHPPLVGGVAAQTAVTDTPALVGEPDLFVYVPTNARAVQPVQVLVAIHGMGGNGKAFCQELLATAERNNWIVVAPTFAYRDYMNPELVLQDDLTFLPRIAAILDSLPARTGVQTREKALLYGHSRGGQMVHRFATLYPERTLGVVAIASGSYTLPSPTALVNADTRPLPLPYGVADLSARAGWAFDAARFRLVPFRIEVGAADTNPDDAPRAWDPYLGRTRVDRARAYAVALADVGVTVTLVIYPGAGHGVTRPMRDDGLSFLSGIVSDHARQYGQGPSRGLTASSISTQAAIGERP